MADFMRNVSLFPALTPQIRRMLEEIPALIDKTFPMPGRFRTSLPSDVAELSRLLTAGRGERGLSYLGHPSLLSAYLRYFLPWNLYRLCRLLPGLDLRLTANDHITDMGCGPLTLSAALWISRPDLRAVPLEFHCIDRSGPALDAGRIFFAALAGNNCPWKIRTTKGDINTVRHTAKDKPVKLVCAVNVFNEMYGDISRAGEETLRRSATQSARLLAGHATEGTYVLVVEPGFPRCGEFISLLRGVFLSRDRLPLSPCTHLNDCPFNQKRWCHFAFETEDAPSALHRLSRAAGLPKERAVLSFLFTGPNQAKKQKSELTPKALMEQKLTPTPIMTQLRVISDAFFLPPRRSQQLLGRYCCSPQGMVLLAGTHSVIEKTSSGALVNARIKEDERDPKSGAFIAEVVGSPELSVKNIKPRKNAEF
jgi:hypothetical protein